MSIDEAWLQVVTMKRDFFVNGQIWTDGVDYKFEALAA